MSIYDYFFLLQPNLGHPSNMQTQLGWDTIQLSEVIVLSSLRSRSVPPVYHIVTRILLGADGSKDKWEHPPKSSELPVRVAVAAISNILKRNSSYYWSMFQITRRWVLQ